MKVILYVKTISGTEFHKACKQAETALAVRVMKDTSEYVPFLNGVLEKNTRVQGNEVVYIADYVYYLWRGKVMVDEQGRHAVFYEGKGWRHRKDSHLHPIDKDLVFTKQHHAKAQARWMEASYADNVEKWAADGEKAVKYYLGR